MSEIKLYILVRTDMESMNAGRTAAQCAHAANLFVKEIESLGKLIDNDNDPLIKNFVEWENQTGQGYGTTIVLDGLSEEFINLKMGLTENEFYSMWVVDPEYPIKDGNTVHLIPNVRTCAFFFAFDEDKGGLKDLELYGN